jgi:hypothetical protein
MEFIQLTNNNIGNKQLHLLVSGITAIYRNDKDTCTIVKHVSHNNGGYEVKESVELILKMIKVNVIKSK